LPGDEEPSALAELHIMLIPASDPADDPKKQEIVPLGNSADAVNWLVKLARRAGLGVQFRCVVPPEHAGGMLAMIRSATWAATVVVTLAIAVSAGVPYPVLITILAIELGGFAVSALSARRKRGRLGARYGGYAPRDSAAPSAAATRSAGWLPLMA
jgi:hypothetical protein